MTRPATHPAMKPVQLQQQSKHMKTKNDSSSPSPVPATSSGLLTIKPADVQPVPTAGSTPAVEVEVKIADLIIDPKLQMRAKPHDGQYIMDLLGVIQAGTLTEPIVVFRDPTNGSYLVADGHARVDATRSSGCATIRARVHEGGFREAFEFALGANAKHGVRRTNADLRHAVLTALADSEIGTWSNVQIAQVCLCSDTFVGIVRNTLAPASGNAAGARRKGGDGKFYPANPPRRAAGSNGPTLSGGPAVAVSPPPTMTHALASTDLGAGSSVAITKGVPTEASHEGRTAEVTTPTNSVHVVHEVVGGMPVEPTVALPGDSSHAVTTPGKGEPTTVPTTATVVIPGIRTPMEAMVALVVRLSTTCWQIRTDSPNLRLPQDLVSEVREEAERFIAWLNDHYPSTDSKQSVSATPGDRFRGMMGYNPRPGHVSDEAILGVLAAEIDQERLTA